jgi:hypothetical protein
MPECPPQITHFPLDYGIPPQRTQWLRQSLYDLEQVMHFDLNKVIKYANKQFKNINKFFNQEKPGSSLNQWPRFLHGKAENGPTAPG